MTPRSYVARTPEDLIALVPYLLGFHPEESVVLLTFGAPAGSFHARVDLPDDAEGCLEVTRMLCSAVRRNAATVTAVLVFSDEPQRARRLCATLVPELQLVGASVVDAIRVDAHSWWSVRCPGDPACTHGCTHDGAVDAVDGGAADWGDRCRADLGPHPYDTTSHPFTAERVFDGQAALRSRRELVDSLRGGDPAEVRRVARAAARVATSLRGVAAADALAAARRHADWLHDRLVAASRDEVLLSSAAAGRVLALVRLPDLREVAWGMMSRERAAVEVRLWRDLVRRAPDHLVARPAAILAFGAWLAGDGALAWCAIDRCLEHDPDDVLAQTVAGLLQRATPPTSWTPVPLSQLRVLEGRRQWAG